MEVGDALEKLGYLIDSQLCVLRSVRNEEVEYEAIRKKLELLCCFESSERSELKMYHHHKG